MILSQNTPLISLSHVTVAYERQPALQDISGCFDAGSLTAIVGPNGAGKSTLVKTIMGDLKQYKGEINKGSLKLKDFGYLPQASDIERHFPLSVADTVLLGAWHKIGAFGGVSKQIADKAQQALAIVGLEGFERRYIGVLSAGQFQRVLFARLLLQDAKIIILDEPFNAIDERTMHDLLALIGRWHQEGRTILAVLHDIEQVRNNFPSTLLLARHLIAWGPTKTTLTPTNLAKAKDLAQGWDEATLVDQSGFAKNTEGAL
ncbi:metal ABC transporter ATP-binding protein [Bartonella sp. HY038]|uniref:metal ABC transporter ATP-binding protein n=1 Tax=Bartonella sp. HY038 TaxID=2759660 RepID=UPI0015FBA0C8|nr:ABC transporter ATP-binding protein [Bartonella sp. HY038]